MTSSPASRASSAARLSTGVGARGVDQQRILRAIVLGGATISIALAFVALGAWIFDLSAIRGFGGTRPMKPNSAVGLVLGGASVLLSYGAQPSSRRAMIGRILSRSLFLLALLTLVDHLVGLDPGFAPSFFRAHDRAGVPLPERMVPTAALVFLLIAGSLELRARRVAASQGLAAAVMVLAIVVLAEHAFAGPSTDSRATFSFTSVAPATAAGLLALGASLFCLRPDAAFVAIMLSDTAGGYLARRLVPAGIFTPMLAGYAAHFGYLMGLYDIHERLPAVVIASCAAISAMIILSSTSLHALDRARRRTERNLAERERELAAALESERAARALTFENARINEILHRLGTALSTEREEDKLVQRVINEAAALTSADVGAFLVPASPSAASTDCICLAQSGASKESVEALLVGAQVLCRPMILRSDDTRTDPRFASLAAGALKVTSLLTVPVVARSGEVFGGLFFAHHEPGRFHEHHERVVAGLASQAAIAIENARLYRALRESEERARAAADQARAADRRKDEFLALLGHELRNPLSPILTALHLMKLRGDSSTGRERAIIERQLQHVSRLVDDLLDVSRITRGKIELNREVLEINQVIAKAIEMSSPLLEQRAQHLKVDVPRDGARVFADPVRLGQVLTNLLTNASKFTAPDGSIQVWAKRAGDEITVAVKDDGIGITPAILPKIWEPFFQGERNMERGQGGLGIGLALVRSLVQLHGGRVEVRSEGPGRGSEFSFTLKALSRAPSGIYAAPVINSRERLDPALARRVLVVDDNADAADLLAETLREIGHEAEVAYDGAQALAIAEHFPFDVALLDIGLPVMDGYDVARRLRDLTHGREVRFFALTGYGQEEDRVRTREAGFEEHFTKPVAPEVVAEALKRPLHREGAAGSA